MRRARVLWTAAVVAAAITSFATRQGVAASTHAGDRLILTSFLQRGRTDVRPNEVLEFRFSLPVRASSVDLRTLQVNEVTPGGEKPAVGARMAVGNVVRFTPRRTQGNYDASQISVASTIEEDHPLGFAADASYVVRLRAGPVVRSLRGRQGQRLARAFKAAFGTGDVYDDPVPGQPSFIGVDGSGTLGFVPPRSVATGEIADDAAIVLEFSEPILPSSLRLGDTVIVNCASTGAPIAGALTPDAAEPNGRRFLFSPAGGWNAATGGHGTDFRISGTTGITDLAGNPLKRPF